MPLCTPHTHTLAGGRGRGSQRDVGRDGNVCSLPGPLQVAGAHSCAGRPGWKAPKPGEDPPRPLLPESEGRAWPGAAPRATLAYKELSAARVLIPVLAADEVQSAVERARRLPLRRVGVCTFKEGAEEEETNEEGECCRRPLRGQYLLPQLRRSPRHGFRRAFGHGME